MKTVEIIGYYRANLGKKASKQTRLDASVPCVLYGGEKNITFHSPMILFRELVYSNEAYKVLLNIEGDHFEAIMQDIQFHPVSEMIMHVDFLELSENKPVKMDVPVNVSGTSTGVMQGGRLAQKFTKLKVSALPKNMPEYVEVDINGLELGKSVRVRDIKTSNYILLHEPALPIVTVAATRATKQQDADAAKK